MVLVRELIELVQVDYYVAFVVSGVGACLFKTKDLCKGKNRKIRKVVKLRCGDIC